jgi:photosystem II stability/assembly factor-like uncharacterized protein
MKTISYHVRFSRVILYAFSFLLLAANTTTTYVEPGVTNIILQSKDGGQTWQDISQGLPENNQPDGFFAGESDVYLRVNNVVYRSTANLKTPVWEKENGLDLQSASIAFNRSGVMAYSYDGQVYRKKTSSDPDSYRDWLPVYTALKSTSVATFFEASDGSVFLGTGKNFFKSTDKARSWKLVQKGWVGDIVEAEGVLLANGQNGIMRSTDNGEHWEWVISEGGVGIAIERIDGGFAAIYYSSSTKSRRIRISLDKGKTWKAIDGGLQPSLSISSIKQIGPYLLCGHPDGIFRSSDMGKTWYSVHPSVDNAFRLFVSRNTVPFSDDRKVFKLYVSGNVVYAVARNSGC